MYCCWCGVFSMVGSCVLLLVWCGVVSILASGVLLLVWCVVWLAWWDLEYCLWCSV